VHPTGGSLRVFKQVSWLEAGSGKAALSRPAHQRVTHTVGTPLAQQGEKEKPKSYKWECYDEFAK